MSKEKEDNAISIIRMKKLLEGITSKIQSIENDVQSSPLFREIIDLIELFKECVISEMKRIPKQRKSMHVSNLLDYQIRIAEMSSEIETLQEIYEEQNSNTNIFLRDIVTYINNEEKIMRNVVEMSEVEISREIEESMRKMLIVKQQEETRKKQLQSEIDVAHGKLQEIIKRNTINEKKLYSMCAQVEQKYTDLFAKYDCDIGTSYTLREKLLKDNEIIEIEMKNMENQLIIQRKLYTRFKKEREIMLMKIFTKKLELFRQTRAAKIIQRIWRMYFERISLKKRRKTRRK